MSLASPIPSSGRSLEEQALALMAFLAARDSILTPAQAATALSALPPDPKPAAKELRSRLNALGVEIKHQNTLKALAEARGAASYLGLADQLHFDLASWSPDSASVSCERVTVAGFAAVADELCKRVREQYEDDAPFVTLHTAPTHLLLVATSPRTSAWWRVLLTPVTRDSGKSSFPSTEPLERFAERLKRLVEGQLGGWVDGTYNVSKALEAIPDSALVWELRLETEFADELLCITEDTEAATLPRLVPASDEWSYQQPLTQAEWDSFHKRYAMFARRHPDTTLFKWAYDLKMASTKPRFEPVAVNVNALEAARQAANISWEALAISPELASDEDGEEFYALKAGRAGLDRLLQVAELLSVDPNALLAPQRTTPRIPLAHHTDLAMWLSRMEAVVSQPPEAPKVAQQLVARLKAFCEVPYEVRRRWDQRPPAELEALNQEIRFAGLMVCAGMGTRYVSDLPLGWQRPASISILEFDRQEDVLTQGGQLDPENRMMDLEPERDSVSPEWLARFNKPRFSASDLLRYSDMVHDTIRPEDDEKGRFTSKVFAGIKVFNRDPEKAHSASVRMEALSRLLKDRPMEPWFRKSHDPEEDSVMISEAAFEAAARCELVNVGGSPGFDRNKFYMLCVQHARKHG